ncbi:MAG: thermonuclease family protein [Gammaproteobacteria bacterium]
MKKRELVTGIIDGDTFETSSRKRPVHLDDVNTPERDKKGYGVAKMKLAKLIRGKEVTVEPVASSPDRDGRTVAKVKVAGASVNAAMKKQRAR